MTFNNKSECIAETTSCHHNGHCSEISTGNFSCVCDYLWDENSFCAKTFFTVYDGKDIYFPIIGYLLIVPLFFLFLVELKMDFTKENKTKKPVFWVKVTSSIYLLSRIVYYSIWMEGSITYNFRGSVAILIISDIGTITLWTSYTIAILLWIDIAIKTKFVKGHKSNALLFTKKIIIVLNFFWYISAPTFRFISHTHPNLGLNLKTIYIIIVFYSFILFISVYFIARTLISLKTIGLCENEAERRFKRKNNILISVNFFFFLIVVSYIAYVIKEIVHIPWKFLIWNTCTRYLEYVVIFLLFLFSESYFYERRVLKLQSSSSSANAQKSVR